MDDKGKIWFTIQGLLAIALLVVPFFSRSNFSMVIRITGALLLATGIILLLSSYHRLGKSHSPGIKPIEEGKLVVTGPYAVIRHPVYASFILIGFGLEMLFSYFTGLIIAVLLFIYYDLRTREEEKWLKQTYPGFNEYKRKVPGRLIPWLY